MKQKVTRFEKSTNRQLAFVLLGVGLIGLALQTGGASMGFDLGVIASWIMLLGFIGATVFMAMAGGAPVPVGNDEIEVEDRVQVVMSDDLSTEVRTRVEQAIATMEQNNKDIVASLNQTSQNLLDKVSEVRGELDAANVSEIAEQLGKFSNSIDLSATTDTLESLKNSASTFIASLDELNNLSVSQTQKLEGSIGEIIENFEASKDKINEKIKTLSDAFTGIESQVNQTLRQSEQSIVAMEQNNKDIVANLNQTSQNLLDKVSEVRGELDAVNVSEIAEQLDKFSNSIDLSATADALESLKNSANTFTASLDELNNLSVSQTQKLEGSIGEITENFEASKDEINTKLKTLSDAFAGIESQVNKTLQQFEQFNQV